MAAGIWAWPLIVLGLTYLGLNGKVEVGRWKFAHGENAETLKAET